MVASVFCFIIIKLYKIKKMQNKNKIITIGVIVIVAILITWLLAGKKQVEAPQETPKVENQNTESPKTNTTQTGTKSPTQSTKPSSNQNANVVTVNYDYNGFTPTIIVIKKGDTVRFINKSTTTRMWVASGPHPAHTAYPGFDQGTSVGYDGSYSFKFTQTGKFPFHNHIDPRRTGTIVVNYE